LAVLSEEKAMLPALSSLKAFTDERGTLSFAEVGDGLPFAPQRYFLVYNVPVGATRGGHAHRRCEQYLIAVRGTVAVTLDDGQSRMEHLLERPDQGLHIPAGIWGEQRYVSDDACLLVLASEPYDANEYLTDQAEFLAFRKTQP
jgi:UDP-2-acetamido-3-amino-2,3-dideoxy-glucuronate N-acetyltransferase